MAATTTTSTAAADGGEERVIATAQKILKSLRTSRDETNDMVSILSSFDNRLSGITDLINTKESATLARFEAAENRILKKENDQSSIWEDTGTESGDYLGAVDEVMDLMVEEGFRVLGLMERAESVVQVAMSRLEEEFRRVLVRNVVPLDEERLSCSVRRVSLSFAGSEGEELGNFGGRNDGGSETSSSSGNGGKRNCYHERGGSLGEDVCVDLIKHDVIVELRNIAERMLRAGFERECCQVYVSARRDMLEECLEIVGVEKLSIEEVQKIEWTYLDEKMKKWAPNVKLVVRVLLRAEKRICEEIFDESDVVDLVFVETAKGCVMQILTFGEAVAIGRRSPEKLFRVLDMHDALADTLRDLQELFACNPPGQRVYREAEGVLEGLRETAKGTLKEFEKAVKGETSKKAIHGGDIHPLSRYVMNYVKLLVAYSGTLNELLEPDTPCDAGDDVKEMSPVGRCITSLLKSLLSNLEDKAGLYEDAALQYIFLMNNELYILNKVMESELRNLLGDDWVRRHRTLIRKHDFSYLRACWTPVLTMVRDEGIPSGSGNTTKQALKERFKNFNAAFEEIYRIQTGWKVPDPQLREELKISLCEKVPNAYRAFVGRWGSVLESGKHSGKYIKYTYEDLDAYLADLFQGTPKVIHQRSRNG
ncbi:hypothetical protein Droror1_Dr00021445 [Drosera rotundifolia]